jgi:hypothetical protein
VGVISQRFGARYGVAVGAVAAVGAGVFGLLTVRKAVRRRATGEGPPVTDEVLELTSS